MSLNPKITQEQFLDLKMKSSFRPTRWLNRWLATLFLCAAALVAIYGSLLHAEKKEELGCAKHISRSGNAPNIAKQGLHFSSAGFSLTNQQGKNENIEQTFCSTLQSEKLIRSNIIDKERIVVLSLRLAWFTQSTYLLTLSPLWHPSIPIAHRKLII